MRKLLLLAALLLGTSSARAQTVTRAEFEALKAQNDSLKVIVGTKFSGMSSGQLAASLVPANAILGGRYPLFLSDYQVRVGIAAIDGDLQNVKGALATNRSMPRLAAFTGAPLTAAQISGVKASMNLAVASGLPVASQRDRISAALSANIYSYGDRDIIDAAKLWFYSGTTDPNRNDLYAYLTIIDQRDPVTNQPLALNDPRWVYVSGTAPAPPPVIVIGNGQTFDGDVVIRGNLTVLGESSFAGPLKPGVGAAIQMHGRGSAEIIGFSNEAGLDAQNPGYVHCGVFSVSNDAGVRKVKGGYWGPNGRVWCDLNRPLAIEAFDSQGDWSISYAASPDATEPGQALVFRQYPDFKRAVLTSMRAAPWTLCLGASESLNDFSKLYCPSYNVFGTARARAARKTPALTEAQLFGHTDWKKP